MNQQEFLESLEKALEENQIDSKDILKLYQSRFEIGYEAGMSDDEIISAFDTIEQIILKYKENVSLKTMNLDLNLLFFSDFVICNSNSKGLHLTVDDGVKQYISIKQDETELNIKPLNKFQSRKLRIKKYDGRLEIGSDVIFDTVKLNNVDCDIRCGNITANKMMIENVSGDMNFNDVKILDQFILNNTNGDISFKSLNVPFTKLSTISGDLKFGEVVLDRVELKTISGNMTMDYCNEEAQLNISSVSGNVCIKHGANFENVKATSVSGCVEISGETKKTGIMEQLHQSIYDWSSWKK